MTCEFLKKVKWHHIALLTFTFFVLDVGSAYIGLQLGATEVGAIMKDYNFTQIALVKFIALIALILLYIPIANDHEIFADRMIYFISGVSSGVFIVNMHQVLYYLQL